MPGRNKKPSGHQVQRQNFCYFQACQSMYVLEKNFPVHGTFNRRDWHAQATFDGHKYSTLGSAVKPFDVYRLVFFAIFFSFWGAEKTSACTICTVQSRFSLQRFNTESNSSIRKNRKRKVKNGNLLRRSGNGYTKFLKFLAFVGLTFSNFRHSLALHFWAIYSHSTEGGLSPPSF